jgi:iron complex outermembrane receptor protein
MNRTKSIHPALWALPLTFTTAYSQTTPATEPTQLDAMTVTAKAEAEKKPYSPPANTTGALKLDIPLLETPQAVTVVDEQLIEDQHSVKLEDILHNVAGISTGGYYSSYDQFRIRGFDASYKTYWDGLHGDNGTAPEMFGMEKVEVIKGPASALYGNAPLGGMVNLVSKRPTYDTGAEIGMSAGSFNTYEGTVDANAALYTPGSGNTDGKSGIYGRIVGLYRDTDTFIDHAGIQRTYIAPSVLFQISEDTKFTILGSYTHDNDNSSMPLPAEGTVLHNPYGHIPIDRYIGIPGQGNDVDFTRLKIGYEFSHKFNDTVSVRQNFNYTRIDQNWDRLYYPQFGGPFDGKTLSISPYSYDDTSERVGVDTGVDFKFDTFSVKHAATVGMDYYFERGTSRSFFGAPINLDLFHPGPDYTQIVPHATLGPESVSGSEVFGFYGQDHMKLTDKVSLTLGGRFDSYEARGSGESETAFSPKAGVTYEFIENVAAYANYSKSFEPQSDPKGAPIDPMEGENIETGVKYSALDGKLTGMASVFQLTRTDALLSTGPLTYSLAGEQRSRGFELENSAEPLPGFVITTAYTYLDAQITKDAFISKGTPLAGVPENALSGWAKYTIQDGMFKGVGFGLGARYVGSQAGDSNNSFEIPSYALLDAALYYEKDNFSAQVNFKNITDKRYFNGSYNEFYVGPGEPFNVSAGVAWKF